MPSESSSTIQCKKPQQVTVIGGSSGIGQALVEELLNRFPEANIAATFYQTEPSLKNDRPQWQQLDIKDPAQIETWSSQFERVDWIINCAGHLHSDTGGPEKSIRALETDFLIESIKINTLPTLLLARYFASALKKSQAPILAAISARVGSIEDNRLGGWYSYRVSKAGLNMALKTLSIEWKYSHPRGCVAALHPGTNNTPLSKPFQANVAPEDLFDPKYTAASFLNLLSNLSPTQSGKFWAWDGSQIPW